MLKGMYNYGFGRMWKTELKDKYESLNKDVTTLNFGVEMLHERNLTELYTRVEKCTLI
jgi:hypothetical protein